MTSTIDTTKVTTRRQLHFNSLDDILADLGLVEQWRDVRALGNWSPGQILQHLAIVMNKSIDGFGNLRPPLWVRVIVRLFFRRRFLTKPMAPGFKLPPEAVEELVPGPIRLQEGLDNLRQAIRRLQTETTRVPNVVLGPLTIDEWNQLHCRHSELHLSFLVPAG